MRFPTLRTLQWLRHNSIDDRALVLARQIGKASPDKILALSSDARDYNEKCRNGGDTFYLRLLALNQALEMHGVEYMLSTGDEYAEYLNTGHMYTPTLIRWRGKYRVQSVGDFIETMERRGIRFN